MNEARAISTMMKIKRLSAIIVVVGILIRIIAMLLYVYAPDFANIPYHHIGDDDRFYADAILMSAGKPAEPTTYYTYFLAFLFTVFWESKILGVMFNIVCYAVTCYLLIKLCRYLEIKDEWKCLGIAVISFMPVHIFLSSSLMREVIMTLLILLANYLMIMWMKEGKWLYALGAVVALIPATIFHTGAIVLACVFAFFFMFYNVQEQRFCVTKKILWRLGAVLMTGLLITFVPDIRRYLLGYIPTSIDGIIGAIDTRYFAEAGSNYLVDVRLHGLSDLLLYTPIKMIYFQFAPMPGDWRGIQDMVAFLIDGCFYLVTILLLIYQTLSKRDKITMLMLLEILAFQGMHAWGVMNSGGAIRHRSKMMGVATFGLIYTLNALVVRKRRNNDLHN